MQGLPAGRAGEDWICYLYERQGYTLVARNYALYGQKKLGEIDLIFQDQKRLIMVEVKTRESETFMELLETVDWRKQAFLRRMAKFFLQAHPEYETFGLQIDVAGVLLDTVDNSVKSVRIIENAIEDLE